MVLTGLNFTPASNGMHGSTKAPKQRPKKEKKVRTATPSSPKQHTPAPATTRECSSAAVSRDDRDTTSPGLVAFSDDESRTQIATSTKESTPPHGNILSTTAGDTAAQPENEDDTTMLNRLTSERQYYRDQITGLQREVWRPGDGDGNSNTDYHDRPGPQLPLEQRWRFYQVQTGNGPIDDKTNMPPKYVILDDQSAWEVFVSDIKRSTTVKYWPHDFGGPGKIRVRRPHRGRPAISDPSKEGVEKYHFTQVGTRNERYYFSGEKDYTPIVYSALPAIEPTTDASQKRKATSPPPEQPPKPRKHGHNQYTPRDQLVKYGAPSDAKGKKRYLPRINTFLRRDPSPEWSMDKARYGGDLGDTTRFTSWARVGNGGGVALGTPAQLVQEESMWVEQDENGAADSAVENTALEQQVIEELGDDASPAIRSPFSRPSPSATAVRADAEAVHNSTETHNRQKPAPSQSFFERMAAEQDAADHPADHPSLRDEGVHDTGSYASRLEVKLAQAKQTIEEQASAIVRLNGGLEEAEGSVRELQGEVAALTEEIAALKGCTAA